MLSTETAKNVSKYLSAGAWQMVYAKSCWAASDYVGTGCLAFYQLANEWFCVYVISYLCNGEYYTVLVYCWYTTDDGDEQCGAARTSRSASDASSRRDSMDSTFSASELDDSGTGDSSVVSAGDTSLPVADGQSSSEEQAGGDMSPFTIPPTPATKDPVRLKCREMLSAALKTPREFSSCHPCLLYTSPSPRD